MATKDKLVSLEVLKATTQADVNDLKSATGNATGNQMIPMTDGAYIQVGDSNIAIDSPTANISYRYAIVPCNAGDIFTINATAASGMKPYGFCTSAGATVDRPYMTSSQILTLNNFVVIAPAGAEYLVVNDNSGEASFYGDAVTNRADSALLMVQSIENNTQIPLTTNFYFTSGSLTGTGKFCSHNYRIASRNYVDVSGYSSVNYTIETGYRAYVAFYSDTKESAYVDNDGWKTGSGTITVKGKYMRLVIDTTGGSTALSPADASNVNITGAYALKDILDRPNYEYKETLADGTDLNTLYLNGWYLLGNAGQYPNSPENTTGQRIVFVYAVSNAPSASSFRHMFYANRTNGVYAHRVYASGNWTKWTFISDDQMTFESFMPTAQTAQGANSGYNLRFMTYNIAKYNNDTSTYISDAQLFALRRMLGTANADIIAIQEDRETIDSAETKNSQSYVFLPQYPYKRGASGGVIHSKMSPIDSAAEGAGINLKTSYERYIRFATYQLTNDIKLLVLCAHPIANYNETGRTSEQSIAARKLQYEEMFDWIFRETALPDQRTGELIYRPEHTHTIIGIDSNCITQEDKDELSRLAAQREFRMANGGALGWYYTELREPYAIDNIIVSRNIIINNAEVYADWYKLLYSDHAPLVSDLTLTNGTEAGTTTP